jgi:hypothetical protein
MITQNDHPVSAADEAELERLVLSYNPEFIQLLEQARARIEQTGGVKHDQFWQLVEAAEP